MKTTNVRKIIFDLSQINENDLLSVGVYKIFNKINNHFYIGSSDRCFKERFKEHCRCYELFKQGTHKNNHPLLWAAYDKYGIDNFGIELIEILMEKLQKKFFKEKNIISRH